MLFLLSITITALLWGFGKIGKWVALLSIAATWGFYLLGTWASNKNS